MIRSSFVEGTPLLAHPSRAVCHMCRTSGRPRHDRRAHLPRRSALRHICRSSSTASRQMGATQCRFRPGHGATALAESLDGSVTAVAAGLVNRGDARCRNRMTALRRAGHHHNDPPDDPLICLLGGALSAITGRPGVLYHRFEEKTRVASRIERVGQSALRGSPYLSFPRARSTPVVAQSSAEEVRHIWRVPGRRSAQVPRLNNHREFCCRSSV